MDIFFLVMIKKYAINVKFQIVHHVQEQLTIKYVIIARIIMSLIMEMIEQF